MHARTPSSPLGADSYTSWTRRPRRTPQRSFSGDSGFDGGELDLSSTSTLASRDSDAASAHTWPRRSGDSLDELDFDALPPAVGAIYGRPSVLAPALAPAPVSPQSNDTARSAAQPCYVGTPIESIERDRSPVVPAMWRGSGAFAHAPPMQPSGSQQSGRSQLPAGAGVEDRGGDRRQSLRESGAVARSPVSYVLPTPRDVEHQRYQTDVFAPGLVPLEPRFRDPRLNLCVVAILLRLTLAAAC